MVDRTNLKKIVLTNPISNLRMQHRTDLLTKSKDTLEELIIDSYSNLPIDGLKGSLVLKKFSAGSFYGLVDGKKVIDVIESFSMLE